MSGSILHSNNSRIIAAVLAVLLIVFGWIQFCSTSSATRSSESSALSARQLANLGLSNKDEKCNEERSAEIDQLVKDGFMQKEAAAKAKQDAFNLCISKRDIILR